MLSPSSSISFCEHRFFVQLCLVEILTIKSVWFLLLSILFFAVFLLLCLAALQKSPAKYFKMSSDGDRERERKRPKFAIPLKNNSENTKMNADMLATLCELARNHAVTSKWGQSTERMLFSDLFVFVLHCDHFIIWLFLLKFSDWYEIGELGETNTEWERNTPTKLKDRERKNQTEMDLWTIVNLKQHEKNTHKPFKQNDRHRVIGRQTHVHVQAHKTSK